MKRFSVTIRTETACYCYHAIARAAIDLYPAAYVVFGACGVTVKPMRAA